MKKLISTLLPIIRVRDEALYRHSISTAHLAYILSLGMDVKNPEAVRAAACLHDVGKIGVTDLLLNKEHLLTPEEKDVIQQHPVIGAQVITEILNELDFNSSKTTIVSGILYHHEMPDGSGYPHKLVGNQIPISAEIIGVADKICAMLEPRPYRDKPMQIEYILAALDSAGFRIKKEIIERCLNRLPLRG
jgi:putative nucleotidyltransferase with HDIG domain